MHKPNTPQSKVNTKQMVSLKKGAEIIETTDSRQIFVILTEKQQKRQCQQKSQILF